MFTNFSFVQKSDTFFDVNYNPYQTTFNEDSFPSSWILFQSFQAEKKSVFYESNSNLLQRAIGINKAVWGYKLNNLGMASWEYYYYYYKVFPNHSYQNIIHLLKQFGLITTETESSNVEPGYYILSFEFNDYKTDYISIYYPHIIEPLTENYKVFLPQGKHYFDTRTAGFFSYKLANNQIVKANYYKGFFPFPFPFSPEKVYLQIITLCELKLPEIANCNLLSQIFDLPFLASKSVFCQPFAIALKKDSIKLYFIKADINNFIIFIKYFNYPNSFIKKIELNKDQLQHLMFDFAIEVSYKTGDKNLTINNPVIYGTF